MTRDKWKERQIVIIQVDYLTILHYNGALFIRLFFLQNFKILFFDVLGSQIVTEG